MSRYRDHDHTTPQGHNFQPAGSGETYAAVVGTIDPTTEHPITGHSGDHLQFYLEIGGGLRYQVDVNTQSRDGSDIEVYVADDQLDPVGPDADRPFGAPAFGVFTDAQLSYQGLGLADAEFAQVSAARIESQLEAALNQSEFVSAYGLTFDDGGLDGTGVHETHYTGVPNQDGALAVYIRDPTTGAPKRTWFFFKFVEDTIE